MAGPDKYIQHTLRPPNAVLRVFSLLLTIAFIVRAVVHPTFENILAAVFFGVLLIPDLAAPGRYRAWLAELERRRPVLGNLVGVVFFAVASFLLLRFFLDRLPSLLIAVVLALTAVIASLIGRRRRGQGR